MWVQHTLIVVYIVEVTIDLSTQKSLSHGMGFIPLNPDSPAIRLIHSDGHRTTIGAVVRTRHMNRLRILADDRFISHDLNPHKLKRNHI